MRRFVAVLLLVAVAGCGEGSGAGEGDTRATPLSADQREAGDVALRYIRAMAKEDWATACETRTRKERREMARLAGECEAGMRAAFSDKPLEMFEKLRVSDVRIRGDVAGVHLVQPGQSEPALTIGAVREGDDWRLEAMPDDRIP